MFCNGEHNEQVHCNLVPTAKAFACLDAVLCCVEVFKDYHCLVFRKNRRIEQSPLALMFLLNAHGKALPTVAAWQRSGREAIVFTGTEPNVPTPQGAECKGMRDFAEQRNGFVKFSPNLSFSCKPVAVVRTLRVILPPLLSHSLDRR